MGRVLGGFQDQVAQCLMGWILHQEKDGNWEYTLAKMSREEVGLQTMDEYIRRRHNTVAK